MTRIFLQIAECETESCRQPPDAGSRGLAVTELSSLGCTSTVSWKGCHVKMHKRLFMLPPCWPLTLQSNSRGSAGPWGWSSRQVLFPPQLYLRLIIYRTVFYRVVSPSRSTIRRLALPAAAVVVTVVVSQCRQRDSKCQAASKSPRMHCKRHFVIHSPKSFVIAGCSQRHFLNKVGSCVIVNA